MAQAKSAVLFGRFCTIYNSVSLSASDSAGGKEGLKKKRHTVEGPGKVTSVTMPAPQFFSAVVSGGCHGSFGSLEF